MFPGMGKGGFNPMQMMGGMPGMGGQGGNPMAQMMQMFNRGNNQTPVQNQNQQLPQLDKIKFKELLPNLNDNTLEQLVNQARQQGLSDDDIQRGLKFIQKMM